MVLTISPLEQCFKSAMSSAELMRLTMPPTKMPSLTNTEVKDHPVRYTEEICPMSAAFVGITDLRFIARFLREKG